MDAEATVRAYYDALRAGDPLGRFFATDESAVKFGISERLDGGAAVERGLAAQTERTTDWTVDSRDLRVTDRGCHAWFSDDVFMAWTDAHRDVRFEFETRWSGTLETRSPDGRPADDGSPRFVGMHVSTANEF